jgi:hypothetical protein
VYLAEIGEPVAEVECCKPVRAHAGGVEAGGETNLTGRLGHIFMAVRIDLTILTCSVEKCVPMSVADRNDGSTTTLSITTVLLMSIHLDNIPHLVFCICTCFNSKAAASAQLAGDNYDERCASTRMSG